MRTELYIPILYSIKREVNRFNHTYASSVIRLVAGMTFDYLWVPIYALLMSGSFFVTGIYLDLIFYVLMFMILYEIGYMVSDNIGIRFEKKELRNYVYKKLPSLPELGIGILIRLLLLCLLFIIFNRLNSYIIFGYVLTLGVFLVHSFVKEKYKVSTFIALRFLKGFVPYAFLIFYLSFSDRILIISGLIGISLYYSIEYASRKTRLAIKLDVTDERNSYKRFILVLVISAALSLVFDVSAVKYFIFLLIMAMHNMLFFFLYDIKDRLFGKNNQSKNL